MMKKSLEDRFLSFLSFLPGSEEIDSLNLPQGKEHNQRADYFLAMRQIIVEVKTLKADPAYKVEKFIGPLKERPDFPIFYGEVEVNKLLDQLPDGEKFKKKLLDRLTKSIETAFKKADDQISDTKDAFNVPYSCGLLVILNETIEVFNPEVIAWKISRMLCKKKDGNYRYRQILCVWIISEGHFIQVHPTLKSIPSIVVDGPMMGNTPEIGDFVSELQPKWAEFEGTPFLTTKTNKLEKISFQSFAKEKEKNRNPVERHKLWRRQYNKNPYLRLLEEKEFLKFGAKVFLNLKPHFLIDGRNLSHSKVEELMIIWTHFLEEGEHRGTDMKKLYKEIESLEN